jgi:hypothetical protein
MLHISPGVYLNIIDQSEFINAVPVVSKFLPFFSDRGPENSLTFINGRKTLRSSFMVDDLSKQGKNFREGWLCLDRWLGISGSAYGMRLLPEDASYANLMYAMDSSGVKPILTLESLPSINSKQELETIIGGTTLPQVDPVAIFHAYARGEWYNSLRMNITEVANEEDTFVIDIYEEDGEGDLFISKSHKISFIENKVDLDGESIYVEDVLEKFSELINCLVNQENFKALDTFESDLPVLGIVDDAPLTPADGERYIISDEPSGTFAANANEIATYDAGTTSWVFEAPSRGFVLFVGDVDPVQYIFDGDEWTVFNKTKALFSAASVVDFDFKQLTGGTSGSLYGVNGIIDNAVATQLLVEAYSGLIDDRVLNTEFIYFPYVFCPYPIVEVSDAAVALSQYYRMDCFTYTTLPDSTSANEDIAEKQANYSYNTWMAALYGNYSRVYQSDLGRNIWVSPIYHMARIVPYTISIASIADAPAGFDHAMMADAKELRYYPLVGDRDNLYIDRINYASKFRNGTCIWQQLTTQMKDSSLSDINVVNVVLYIKRVVKTFCMNFIYFRNVPETHSRIKKALDEFLKDLQDKGWIQKYNVDVGATEYEYKQKIAHVNIIIWPTKIIERIVVNEFIR